MSTRLASTPPRPPPPTERKNRPAARPYVLPGLMTCGLCVRTMQSLWANKRAH